MDFNDFFIQINEKKHDFWVFDVGELICFCQSYQNSSCQIPWMTFFLLFFHLWSRIIIKLGTLLLYNIFFLIILTFKSSKSVKNWQSYATFFFASKILAQYVNNVTHDANMTRSELFWRLLNQNISTSVNTISEITLGEL